MGNATAAMGARGKYGQYSVPNGSAGALVASDAANPGRTSYGICVKALSTNTHSVWVGGDSSVTNSNGFELTAGQSITLPLDDQSRVYCYAAFASQSVCWIGV